jgi:hypothetical protein
MRTFLAGFTLLVFIGQARPADSPLEPLSWLTGGSWVSELKPAKGDPITIRMVVNWTANKQAITYTIYFKTKDTEFAQYDGIYVWHPSAKEIRLLQTDRGGGVTESVITVADGKWTQKNVHTNKDGVKSNQRAELTRDGDDAFRFQAFIPKGDEWIQALDATYKRVKDSKPAK